jgi:hypothetical protein
VALGIEYLDSAVPFVAFIFSARVVEWEVELEIYSLCNVGILYIPKVRSYVCENYGTPKVSTTNVKDPMNTSLGQRLPPFT